jgi:1-phosphofructokinase/tagatose 6-phosphate kinase
MDRISTWPPLRLAAVNRAATVTVVPGGKGFNVARAAVRLGEDAVIYGFLGGHVGEALREMIGAGGVIDRHTTIAAGTRVCFIVVEPQLGRSTVLNEPGPEVTAEEVARLLQELRSDCQPADLVVLSGSLPDSVAAAVAGEVIKTGNDAGARTIVDIHGEALHEAVAQRPWMLKCNRHELLQLLGDTDSEAPVSVSRLARQMHSVRERGIAIVVVTMGPAGALLADADGVVHAQVPQIEEVNPTGSGDLLLAGLAVGIQQQRSVREALVLGAACGTAGATHLPPELPPDFEAARWSADIDLEVVVAA